MRKGKNRYIVEVNDWGCGLMIKDTQTGREIDAPDDEVITLCIKEMNSLAKELDTVRSVAQDNQAELKATRIENARLKAEVERLTTIAPKGLFDFSVENLTRLFKDGRIAEVSYEAERSQWYCADAYARCVRAETEAKRLKAEVERLTDEVGLMNQLWNKYLTPEIRKAMVKEAKEGKPRA
jgi:cell division protein FtsB